MTKEIEARAIAALQARTLSRMPHHLPVSEVIEALRQAGIGLYCMHAQWAAPIEPDENMKLAARHYKNQCLTDGVQRTYGGYFRAMRDAALSGRSARAPDRSPHHKLDTDEQVFFYEQDFYVLSNFSAFNLYWNHIYFDTSEAAYHWEKFPGPQCAELRRDIITAPSAHAAFKLAEENKHRRRPDWDGVKVRIMRAILHAKVDQHEYVRRKLLETGTRHLIEDSWRDEFWGWGPNRDGQNMLGRLWMEIRAEIAAARSPSSDTTTEVTKA